MRIFLLKHLKSKKLSVTIIQYSGFFQPADPYNRRTWADIKRLSNQLNSTNTMSLPPVDIMLLTY